MEEVHRGIKGSHRVVGPEKTNKWMYKTVGYTERDGLQIRFVPPAQGNMAPEIRWIN